MKDSPRCLYSSDIKSFLTTNRNEVLGILCDGYHGVLQTTQSDAWASEIDILQDSFIESCSELDYKALARNPDNYIGQNYYFVCYVSSVRTGGLTSGYQKYCVTYAFDIDEARERVENGYSESLEEAAIFCTDYDTCVWLVDNRDESDSDYTKILDNDIAIVYGTFTGLTTSKNSLTNETSEKVSLDIKYVDIIEE